MNIIGIAKTYKKLKRLNQIIPVLIKYGFGGILKELKIDYYFYLSKNIFKIKEIKNYESLSNAKRFTLALKELGPTFIKLGQVLSTREDLFNDEWITELETLQDKTDNLPFNQIKSLLQDDFSYIDEKPLASASIAQVHFARLKDNREVVIKIKKPQIDEIIETDILLLKHLAILLETYIPETRNFRPLNLVEEFEDIITKEIDFYHERQNMRNFKQIFDGDEFIYVPEVYEEFCNKNYLVIEYIKGTKITNLDELCSKGIDLKELTIKWSKKVIEQILVYGFFHADPHPGNIFILDDGRLAYVDFGMMGRLTGEMRAFISKLIFAISDKDIDEIIKILSKMSNDFYISNMTKFKKELLDFIESYYNVKLKNFDVGMVLKEMLRILRRHNITLIVDYVLLDKAMLTIESISKKMYPEFNVFDNGKEIVKEVIKNENNFHSLKKRATKNIQNINELLQDIPNNFSEALKQLVKSNLEIKFYHKGLDEFTKEIDKSANRLTFGIIISAIVIASSFIIKSELGPSIRGLSIFGVAGLIFASILGLWLIYGILKSGRL